MSNMKEQHNEDIKRIDTLIDRFIHSEMTKEEEAAFLAEVKADAALSEYVRTTMQLIKGVQKAAQEDDEEMLRMLKMPHCVMHTLPLARNTPSIAPPASGKAQHSLPLQHVSVSSSSTGTSPHFASTRQLAM